MEIAQTAQDIKAARKRRKRAEALLESRHLPDQPEVECGCCYADYPSTQITTCVDGHVFCLECAKRAAQNVIGLRKTELKCISTDSCKFDFSMHEIQRFLPEKEFRAYEVLLQEKEISKANLEGFVQCPFCPL
jgi:E3 ubiquitin-protein ligase RNF216